MLPVTVTIDTNCINALGRDQALNQLEVWDKQGVICIAKTRVMLEELAANEGPNGELRRAKAALYDTGVSGFTLGYSCLDGDDELDGPDAYSWLHIIEPIVNASESGDPGIERDILHLSIHAANGWDYFVTRDQSEFLDHVNELSAIGIEVRSPEQMVSEVRRRLRPVGKS